MSEFDDFPAVKPTAAPALAAPPPAPVTAPVVPAPKPTSFDDFPKAPAAGFDDFPVAPLPRNSLTMPDGSTVTKPYTLPREVAHPLGHLQDIANDPTYKATSAYQQEVEKYTKDPLGRKRELLGPTEPHTVDFTIPQYPVGGIGPPNLKHIPITTEGYPAAPQIQPTESPLNKVARDAYAKTGDVRYLQHAAMTEQFTRPGPGFQLPGLGENDNSHLYMELEEADLPPNFKRAAEDNRKATLDPNNIGLTMPHPWILQGPNGKYAVRKGEARDQYIQWWEKQKKLGGAEQKMSAEDQAAALDQRRRDNQYDQTPYPGALRAALRPEEQQDVEHLKGQLLNVPRPENTIPEDALNLPGYVGGKAKRAGAGVIGIASHLRGLSATPEEILTGQQFQQDQGLKSASETLGKSAQKTLEANPVDSRSGKFIGAIPDIAGAIGATAAGGPIGAAAYGAAMSGGNAYQSAFDDVYHNARVNGLDDQAAKNLAHAKAFGPAMVSAATGAVLQQLRLPPIVNVPSVVRGGVRYAIENGVERVMTNPEVWAYHIEEAVRHTLAGGTIGGFQDAIDQVAKNVGYGKPIDAQEILDSAIDNAAISAATHLGARAFGEMPARSETEQVGDPNAPATAAPGAGPRPQPGQPGTGARTTPPPSGGKYGAKARAKSVNPAENDARETLGIPLDEELNETTLKQYHRAAVMRKGVHPDRGGTTEAFQQVMDAFASLEGTYKGVAGEANAKPQQEAQPEAKPNARTQQATPKAESVAPEAAPSQPVTEPPKPEAESVQTADTSDDKRKDGLDPLSTPELRRRARDAGFDPRMKREELIAALRGETPTTVDRGPIVTEPTKEAPNAPTVDETAPSAAENAPPQASGVDQAVAGDQAGGEGGAVEKRTESGQSKAPVSVGSAEAENPPAVAEPKEPEKPEQPKGRSYGTLDAPDRNALGEHFAEQFAGGKAYPTIGEARREAGEKLGGEIKPGTAAAKMVDEAVEIGVVRHAHEIVSKSKSPRETFDKLLDLYNRQPNLNVRTSTSIEQQAYSTPAPLAFLSQHMAGVTPKSTVYEPTAGNGMLVIGVPKKNAIVNELNPERAGALKAMGYDVTTNDAADFSPTKKVDAVIANPPFGAARDESGRKSWTIDGVETNELDHAITLRALQAMKPGGSATIILGAKGADATTQMEKRKAYTGKNLPFYRYLYDNFNVVDHFTVNGDLYARQGAKFPVDVIVIHGKGKSARPYPWQGAGEVKVYNDWRELGDHSLALPQRPDSGVVSGGTGTGADVDSTPAVGQDNEPESLPAAAGGSGAVDVKSGGGQRPETGVQGSGTPEGGGSNRPAGSKPGQVRKPRPADRPVAGGPAAPVSEPEPSEVESASESDDAGGAGDKGNRSGGVAGNDRPTEPRVAKPKVVQKQEETTEHQAAYEPAANIQSVGTLVPKNMATPIAEALADVQAQHGDLVKYVADSLQFPEDSMGNRFSAEQVDALALGIRNLEKNSALILGDQTGVGKGRVVAGLIRYAQLNDMLAIFCTQQAALFGDMVRDLDDIGMNPKGKPFEPLPTNKLTGDDKIPLPDGRILSTRTVGHEALVESAVESYLAGGDLEAGGKKYGALFTTYSQLQAVKGKLTWRHNLLAKVSRKAFLILDESHEAGGTKKERMSKKEKASELPGGRAAFIREMLKKVQGALYSSATYAKRPDVMSLYSKTDMALAVKGDVDKLAAAIEQGGVPLQQVTANMLAQVGQYIRRERTFAGVEFIPQVVKVDLKVADQLSEAFRAVRDFDLAKADGVAAVEDQQVGEGGGMGVDTSTGEAGVTSTNFASIVWNVVDQMLLALKADQVAATAIAAHKAGERPIVVVDNTMEAVLDRFIDEAGLKKGDPVPHDFKALVHRYLERSREVIIKDADGNQERHYLTDAELGPVGLAAYNHAKEVIEKLMVSGLPISPIDYIIKKLSDAGVTYKEITGRGRILNYRDNGPPLVADRPGSETGVQGKVRSVKAFNDAKVHAIILNRSASTGLSLHSSPKFGDQRKRHMIIGQAAKNIDTFMQMLGRAHRTGQVLPPKYTLLLSDAPAENRPAAVLVKKLASLNASVTANSKGAVSFDVPDLINEVGDSVVGEFLQDNPEMAHMLDLDGETLDGEGKFSEGLAAKATGRAALMPVSDQQEFWAELMEAFETRITELNAMNDNPLVAQTMDLDAKSQKEMPIFDGTEGSDSPFAGPATLHEMDIKRQGKPYTSEQVKEKVREALGGNLSDDTIEKWKGGVSGKLAVAFEKYVENTIDKMADADARFKRREAANTQLGVVLHAIENWNPSTKVMITAPNGDEFHGFVLDLFQRGKPKNPAASSSWNLKVAVTDNLREITIPLSRISRSGYTVALGGDASVSAFDNAQSQSRETRYIATGNLLAAFSEMEGQGGRIINYSDHEGKQRQGILMPKKFEPAALLDKNPVVFSKPVQVLDYLNQNRAHYVQTTDDQQLKVLRTPNGITLEAPKSKAKGAKYTLNKAILRAAGEDFTSVGSKMRLAVDFPNMAKVLKAIMDQYPLGAFENKDPARVIMGEKTLAEQTATFGTPRPNTDSNAKLNTTAKPFYSKLQRTIEEKMPARATPEQVRALVTNAAVKADELKWSGLDDYLRDKKAPVTKAEVLEYLRENNVEVQEVMKGQAKAPLEWEPVGNNGTVEAGHNGYFRIIPRPSGFELRDRHAGVSDHFNTMDEAKVYAQTVRERVGDATVPTKFSQYQLPGGKNYRELLLTLPSKPSQVGPKGWGDTAGGTRDSENFRGGHWDEPNVLAHVRFSDRTAAGKKILHVEEVQSDWHQQGREKGYKGTRTELPDGFKIDERKGVNLVGGDTLYRVLDGEGKVVGQGFTREAAVMKALGQLDQRSNAVPDAPFSKNWHELAMKRMLRMAAENGYDKLAWSPGEIQNERYDLSKSIDELSVVKNENGKAFYQAHKDGKEVMDGEVDQDKLDSVIGKELAAKVLENPKPHVVMRGIDLKVGGSGMKGFYDKILPDFLNKYAKKWGGRVAETRVRTSDTAGTIHERTKPVEIVKKSDGYFIKHENGDSWGVYPTREDAEQAMQTILDEQAAGPPGTTIPSIDITPAMRKSVMEEGQPLFRTQAGTIPPKDTNGQEAQEQGIGQAGTGLPDRARDQYRQALEANAPAGATVTEHSQGWAITRPDGRTLDVRLVEPDQMPVPREGFAESVAAHYGGQAIEGPDGSRIVVPKDAAGILALAPREYDALRKAITIGGAYVNGGILLNKQATGDIGELVREELFHAKFDQDLTDAQRTTLLNEYGDEERAFQARPGNTPGGQILKGMRQGPKLAVHAVLAKPIKLTGEAFKTIGQAINWYSQPLIERVEGQAGLMGKRTATTARHANDYARRVVGELNPKMHTALSYVSGRSKQGRKAVRELRQVRMVNTPDVNYGYSVFQSAVEAQQPPGLGQLTITKAADRAVKNQRALVMATGAIMVRDGWKVVESSGKVRPFVPVKDGKRMLRSYTTEYWDAVSRPDFDPMKIAIAKAFGHANSKPWQDMMKEMNDSYDPATKKNAAGGEILRTMRYSPTHVEHPETGRVVQIMHSEPFDAAAMLVRNFSNRAGYIKHFGQDLPGQDVTNALIDGFRKNGGNPEDIKNLIKTFHGIPLDPLRMASPGTLQYEAVRMFRGFYTLAKAGGLGLAAVPNLFETLTKTLTLAGAENYVRAWATILSHPVMAPRALADMGARTVDIQNWMGRKGHGIEAMVKNLSYLITAPLKLANELNELQSAAAGASFAANLPNSGPNSRDAATLRLLGYNEDEIRDLTSATPPADLLATVPSRMAEQTQGTTSRPSELPNSAHNRLFRNILPFQHWPAMTANRVVKMLAAIARPGIGAKERAHHARILGSMFGGSLLAGAMSLLLMAYLRGGKDEVAVKYAEAIDEPTHAAYEALKFSVLGGLATTIGESVMDNHDTRLMGPLLNASMPVSMLEELYKATRGVGPYKGETPLERFNTFMGKRAAVAPALATAMAAWGLGDKNVKLDVALRAYYRWRRQNPNEKGEGGPDVSGPDGEAFKFTRAMRQYMDAAQHGDDEKAMAALSDALDVKAEELGKGASEAVATAIRARQILAHLSYEEQEKLGKHIGRDAYDELEEFDMLLEGWARMMKPQAKPAVHRKMR